MDFIRRKLTQHRVVLLILGTDLGNCTISPAAGSMSDAVVRLRVGGVLFEVEKATLLRVKGTYFEPIASGAWRPDADGAYLVDRPAIGFDKILEYLSLGNLSVEGLTEVEEECMYSNLNYFLIPYIRQWRYNTESVIEGFRARYVIELKDGRLCGVYKNDIIVWNLDTSVIAMTMKGHTHYITGFTQLQDGRVCSCSNDDTMKLWSIDSGLCELTLDRTDFVICIVQLFDGRVCSGSRDETLQVWNVLTGACELSTISGWGSVRSIAQLADGRICCGGFGIVSIYSVLTGECELSWKGHANWVNAIVCIDATRVCSGSHDKTIKVWNTTSGECERTLEGHTGYVTSMLLMQDGRLCSGSNDGSIKLWNILTGECEKQLECVDDGKEQVLQLKDGRLLYICEGGVVLLY